MLESAICVLFALGAVLQAGCNSDTAAPCNSGGDSSPPAAGCDGVMCTGSSPSFPMFDKACMSLDDCVIGVHQTNCCGATLAIGMTRAEQARFADDEKTCLDQYPLCACPAVPTVAEDGQIATDGKTIVVECQSGRCMTTVK